MEIRENYNIVKAKVSASCKYYSSYYELNIWFDGDDINSNGRIYNIGMYSIKELAGVKRGDGFKKIQLFLDSKDGLEWLSKEIQAQCYQRAKDKIKESVNLSIYKIDDDIEKLRKLDEYAKELINNM